MADLYRRGGGGDDVDESNFDEMVDILINDLRTEEFETPDDEHTQVSIGNDYWGVTADVSGLITFSNYDFMDGVENGLPQKMHLRDIPDSELRKIWLAVVQVNQEDLLLSNWVQYEQLPEYTSHYYRK